MKIRYTCVKELITFNKTFTIEEIENGEAKIWMDRNYTSSGVLHRDRFTGLKDKNGKEIYEGDVCKKHYDQSLFPNRTEDTGVVEWVGFGARFTLRMPHQNGHNYYSELYENLTQPEYIRSPFEVIGNLYENPSLLTQ